MRKKHDGISLRWNAKQNDFVFTSPGGIDVALCNHVLFGKRMHPKLGGAPWAWGFDPSFVNELEARGYDLKTLKFSVKKKKGA